MKECRKLLRTFSFLCIHFVLLPQKKRKIEYHEIRPSHQHALLFHTRLFLLLPFWCASASFASLLLTGDSTTSTSSSFTGVSLDLERVTGDVRSSFFGLSCAFDGKAALSATASASSFFTGVDGEAVFSFLVWGLGPSTTSTSESDCAPVSSPAGLEDGNDDLGPLGWEEASPAVGGCCCVGG